MPELRDFQRGTILYAYDGVNYIPVLVTEDGGMYVLLQGVNPAGDPATIKTDADGQLITIMRGASGVDVNVDPDGFMTTVIKGNYAGDLRTIWVDSDGRLMAFPVDEMDVWGQYVALGNAELAARLGSPVNYERGGQTQLIESFENGWRRWQSSTSGTGGSVALSAWTYKTGGYSLELIGGSDAGRTATVWLETGLLPLGRMGMTFSFSIQNDFGYIRAFLYLYSGARRHQCAVVLDRTTGRVYVMTLGGVYEDVGAFTVYPRNAYTYFTLKLVVDCDLEEWASLRFCAEEYDVAGIPTYSGASGEGPRVRVEFLIYSRSGYNDAIFVDDIILTGAEP